MQKIIRILMHFILHFFIITVIFAINVNCMKKCRETWNLAKLDWKLLIIIKKINKDIFITFLLKIQFQYNEISLQ